MTPPEPSLAAYPRPLARYFAATRPAFLSVTLVACLLGLAGAVSSGLAINGLTAALTVLFALVTHAGVNVLNDYYDARNGTDSANTARLFPFTGGSRFIQNGVLSPAATATFGYALLATVIPAGLWLAWQSGPGLVVIGLLGLLAGWAYSAPPLQLVSRGLGEIAITLGWLAVVVGSDYVQRHGFSWQPVALGLPYALLVANLLFINQFPDRQADTQAGKATLVVRLGPGTARWLYLGIALFAYLWLILLIGLDRLPQRAALGALTAPLSLHAGRMLLADAERPEALLTPIQLTILAANLHGLLLALGLWLAGPGASWRPPAF